MRSGFLLPTLVAVAVLSLSFTGVGLPVRPPVADSGGLVFDLEAARVLEWSRSGGFLLSLPTGPVRFDLQPNPIAAGAMVGLDGAPVSRVAETVTFEGTANGFPARLAATQAGVFAVVFAEDPLLIEPTWLSRPGAPLDEHRLVLWSQARPQINDEQERPSQARALVEPAPPQILPTGPANRVVHFLLEEDFALYDRTSFGGQCPDCWVQVQQAILNVAEALFDRQTGVSFEITSQWACTSVAACPYVGLGMGTWLDAFRTRWETIVDEPPHELGHLLSGTNLNNFDGMAFTGVVNTPDGYALSEFLAVVVSGAVLSVAGYWLVAHEIGHNFNAVHQEADVLLGPPQQNLSCFSVATIMHPCSPAKFWFSDGLINASHNNVARVVAHALQQLPP